MDFPITQDQRYHLLPTGDPDARRAGGGPALMPPTDRLLPTRQTWVPWNSGVSNPWPAPRLWALPVRADLPHMCQDHSCRLTGTRETEKEPILLRKQAEKPHPMVRGHITGLTTRPFGLSQTHDQVSAVSQDGQVPSGTSSTLTLCPGSGSPHTHLQGANPNCITWGRFQTSGRASVLLHQVPTDPASFTKVGRAPGSGPAVGIPTGHVASVGLMVPVWEARAQPPPDRDRSSCAWSAVQCRGICLGRAGCP